ncbi:hypothetical protein CHLNCDRAFT_136113 [Chlorella variabilis]|uniref:Ubiquitin-like-conjugating enzyme ATG10 n=1 Tax=Chlorella variabilis TaxID=554065 RepID=E1ZJS5_CHLVA|nr:hypothetical protein CHLNCDRAFT_136113 [Chlorella variabilis]EFN54044.1 hypothetical protein CHLNCDRAFT_136113 [Chlorella variabilis]|eukprot:XP_005846146.1 hypothetical protein CHLNCDRAFT_136113 [Chlorella variabilis]
MITAEEFAAGAQMLAAAWGRCLAGDTQWCWQASTHPFAASVRTVLPPPLPPEAAPAAAGALPPTDQPSSAQRKAGSPGPASTSSGDVGFAIQEEEEDPASVAGSPAGSSSPPQLLTLTCHVAYHPSYRVPVLYFEAVGPNGVPLGLGAEHPLLRRPFYMLHPCQTEAIMQLLTNPEDDSQLDGAPAAAAAGSREATGATALPPQAAPAAHGRMLRYLLAWLSVAGQPLGLSPPVELWLQASS